MLSDVYVYTEAKSQFDMDHTDSIICLDCQDDFANKESSSLSLNVGQCENTLMD